MLKIQYASDIHINDWPKGTPFELFITPVAPILILAGDICSAWDPLYLHFLAWTSRNWYKVILITGNHEYYSDDAVHTIDQTDAHIANLVKQFDNVVFLQAGASYGIPGTKIRFVGATLWSAIDPAIWSSVAAKKGDFKATYTSHNFNVRKTLPSDISAYHAYHKSCLRSAIAPQQYDETLIVITHHLPTLELLETQYKNDAWRSCYASADDDLFASNIMYWICGHSHRAERLQIPNGPLILMNSRGYNRADELNRTTDIYNPKAFITVKIDRNKKPY
jgi:hypothetical protein